MSYSSAPVVLPFEWIFLGGGARPAIVYGGTLMAAGLFRSVGRGGNRPFERPRRCGEAVARAGGCFRGVPTPPLCLRNLLYTAPG